MTDQTDELWVVGYVGESATSNHKTRYYIYYLAVNEDAPSVMYGESLESAIKYTSLEDAQAAADRANAVWTDSEGRYYNPNPPDEVLSYPAEEARKRILEQTVNA